MKKMVNAPKGPAAVGPYSHSILANEQLFISGQLGIIPETGKIPADVKEQAKQGFENMKVILAESGYDFTDVVKTTVFLTSMADFGEVNKIYGEYFSEWKPARSCIAVKELPMGGLFEIEALAVK